MNRREAIYLASCIFGGTLVGAQAFISGCSPANSEEGEMLGPAEKRILDEIGEAIIPSTEDSPGAQAAGIGAFMIAIVGDCYEPEEQKVFLAGLKEIQTRCKEAFGKAFLQLGPQQQQELLRGIDTEAKAADAGDGLPHYFTLMKQLTVLGYFTSEVGATQALRFVEVPGRFEGCVAYEQGEKAWAL